MGRRRGVGSPQEGGAEGVMLAGRMPKRGERGFTLVETIVAVLVLSLVGLAAAQFAVTAIRTSYAQQMRSTAVSLGDDGVERVQAQIALGEFRLVFRRADQRHGRVQSG